MGRAALVLCASLVFALLPACKPKGAAAPNPKLSSSESWCPDGFEVGPSDTCFAIPDKTEKDTPVLVYLHGMYTGHGDPKEWELVHTAVNRGFAVVVPRGKRGSCAWKAELKDHFCWPQEAEDPHSFKQVVSDWERVLWQVDALLEAGTHKRYVLGYSNGGFFASYLATHPSIFPAAGYSIVNGGPLAPPGKSDKAMPVMLVAAKDDADQGPKMKELHETLTKAGFAHAFCGRPGAHPLSAEDVDASLRFFKHEHDGSLKAPYPCDGAAVLDVTTAHKK